MKLSSSTALPAVLAPLSPLALAALAAGGLTLSAAASTSGSESAGVAESAVTTVTRSSSAADYPQEFVPADANFVAHFDMDHFKRTQLWRMLEPREAELGFDDIEDELGFDVVRELRSVTLFGRGGEPDAVLLIASDAVDAALDHMEDEGKLHRFREGGLNLFELDDATGFVAELRGGDRVLILGEGIEDVAYAARVVRGDEASQADARGTLTLQPNPGAFLSVGAEGVLPGLDDFEPASQVLGLAQGFQFDLGEAGGSLFLHLSLDTGSVETARDVHDTVQGLMALARIAVRSSEEVPQELDELLYALSVSARGGAVTVDFEYPVQTLVEMLDSMDHDH